MPPQRVLILYNEPVLAADHRDADSEHEILYTADAVQRTLQGAGYEVSRLGVSYEPDVLLAELRRQQPDVVFNLYEGTATHGQTEAYAAGLLEWFGVPFTGCPSHSLALAKMKHLAKHLLRSAGLPTAEFFVVEDLALPPCPLAWPVIVKPATQDASVGLDQGSVVTDQEKLLHRCAYLLQEYGPPVLVEQFIDGREFCLGVIETPQLITLPVSEIKFIEKRPGFWPIVTYDAKWKPGTEDYEATPPLYPTQVTPKLGLKLAELAIKAFRQLGCRDYARVDFRVRPNGRPYILEVNPNPDFSPDAGLSAGLTSAGLSHAQFTLQMVENALARAGKSMVVSV
jgi:D-alanine-D-alanine ligase